MIFNPDITRIPIVAQESPIYIIHRCRRRGTLVRSYHHRLAGVVRSHRGDRGAAMEGYR